MKKIILLIIAFVFILASKVFAISYDVKNIELNLNPTVENTKENINGAKLIEIYLIKLKNNVESFKDKYGLENDKEIIKFLGKIDKMIFSLRKIQTISIEKSLSENVMKSIIADLKSLNPEIKSYLKEKKKIVESQTLKIKLTYIELCNGLIKNLSSFIENLIPKLEGSKNKDKIISIINELENERKKLNNFKNIQFQNPEQVKSSFLRILNNIKKEFSEIKKLINLKN